MRLLIDSHILLWSLFEPHKLKSSVKTEIKLAEEVYVSVVTLWELAIKHSKGKLLFSPEILQEGVKKLGMERLSINQKHIANLTKIQLTHFDPFDAMLISQADYEGLYLVTADRLLIDSPYKTIAN